MAKDGIRGGWRQISAYIRGYGDVHMCLEVDPESGRTGEWNQGMLPLQMEVIIGHWHCALADRGNCRRAALCVEAGGGVLVWNQ